MKEAGADSGFTVIEVIVALMILTMSLAALYRGMTASFSGLNIARVREGIVNHGLSELEMLRRFPGRNPEQSGTYSNGMRWQITSERLYLRNPPADAERWPIWAVFVAKTPGGQEIVTLRTIVQP